jgi:hypothetical protein
MEKRRASEGFDEVYDHRHKSETFLKLYDFLLQFTKYQVNPFAEVLGRRQGYAQTGCNKFKGK